MKMLKAKLYELELRKREDAAAAIAPKSAINFGQPDPVLRARAVPPGEGRPHGPPQTGDVHSTVLDGDAGPLPRGVPDWPRRRSGPDRSAPLKDRARPRARREPLRERRDRARARHRSLTSLAAVRSQHLDRARRRPDGRYDKEKVGAATARFRMAGAHAVPARLRRLSRSSGFATAPASCSCTATRDDAGRRVRIALDELDLGDIVEAYGTADGHAEGGAERSRRPKLRLLTKAHRPLPTKTTFKDVEQRYRHALRRPGREPATSRAVFQRARLHRDASSARSSTRAASSRSRRRRCTPSIGGARREAVPDAPQRARHEPVHAHRARALPEAARRRRVRTRLRARRAATATRASPRATTPSSRCSSTTRRSPRTRRSWTRRRACCASSTSASAAPCPSRTPRGSRRAPSRSTPSRASP
jgi:hypothetical protein